MKELIFLDGAMGTMLQTMGLKPGECPELLNISHPNRVKDVHRSYANAGADIVETNTFGGNRIKLGEHGLSDRAYELNYAGVRLAKEATQDMEVLVGASMGPTGRLLEPFGDLDFDTCYEAFREQAQAFHDAGADIISIETMSQLGEARCALIAAKDATDLPIICHMSFEQGGRTLMGTDPSTAINVFQAIGASAAGANCSVGPTDMIGVIRAMAESGEIPLSAEPNAGLPEFVDGTTVYPESPETMAEHAEELFLAGASIIGGCCGTRPEHISAIRRRLGKLRGQKPAKEMLQRILGKGSSGGNPKMRISGRTLTVDLGEKDTPGIIGFKIDARLPEVAERLRNNDMDFISAKAREQFSSGARVLMVRLDAPGVDEVALMKDAINAIQMATGAPVAIVSQNPAAVEAGVKAFWGRALICTTDGARDTTIETIARRFGAAIAPFSALRGGIIHGNSEDH